MAESWTLLKMLRWMTGFFEEKGIASPRLEAELLLAHTLQLDRVGLYMNYDRPLSAGELDQIRPLVKKRGQREPLQYLLGYTEFWSRRFNVSPAVLIPRQDTEILVEEALRLASPAGSLLDVGTGSGAIVISLAGELPGWTLTGIDISADALAVARDNAILNQLADRVELVPGDLARLPEQRYDLIVSNPPYIARQEWVELMPEVRCHEPEIALLAENDGLYCYQELARQASTRLQPGGWLVVETGATQTEAVCRLFIEAGLSDTFVRKDYSGLPRVVGGQLK
ncbi:peptide chain release factor N(5)-glutamine methyltransferase [Pelobacter seleniigenes]|uniref:peptide chain release factor N(5)-glutamine methyltransferase n=1 Tax=Pelobacter seleniigenes TaxID=407188 RepID=UPI0004A73E89|nr:peptide chain release factor N(5)-glutamine methyltransferase [Pelobacter seleniigenes]